jgi:hypothetical protein
MNITQDVITDLLPVYFSGESSGDTRAIVDSFFREHPDFEKLAKRSIKVQLPAEATTPANGEIEVLRRVQRKIRRRGTLLGLAISLTLAPLSFTAISFGDQGTHIKWFMLRDKPQLACALLLASSVLWGVYAITRLTRRTAK